MGKLIASNDDCLNRNIDDVDKTMDEINEQTENMKQIQEALSAPIGAAADFDEVTSISQTSSCMPTSRFSEIVTSMFVFCRMNWRLNWKS